MPVESLGIYNGAKHLLSLFFTGTENSSLYEKLFFTPFYGWFYSV